MRFADGIFAKRVIPHFRLVAVYAGNRLNQTSYDALFSKSIILFYLKTYKFFITNLKPNIINFIEIRISGPNNVTDEEYENIQKNLISLNDNVSENANQFTGNI